MTDRAVQPEAPTTGPWHEYHYGCGNCGEAITAWIPCEAGELGRAPSQERPQPTDVQRRCWTITETRQCGLFNGHPGDHLFGEIGSWLHHHEGCGWHSGKGCDCGLAAVYFSPPGVAQERPPIDVALWREMIWLHHGHDGLYGDDGEMQCPHYPPTDFKRAAPDLIDQHLVLARLAGGSVASPDQEEPS
jgi:hypothetical protein